MIGGHANTTGFVIRDKGQGIIKKTKGFKEDIWNKKPFRKLNMVLVSVFRLVIMAISVFFLIKFLLNPWWISLFIGAIVGLGAICFSDLLLRLIISIFMIGKKDFREYHACEHKVINLLQSEPMLWAMAEKKDMPVYFWGVVEKQITIENLQNEPSIHPGCGSGPWFVQKYFTTKEPSREKLEEALEIALEYCRQFQIK